MQFWSHQALNLDPSISCGLATAVPFSCKWMLPSCSYQDHAGMLVPLAEVGAAPADDGSASGVTAGDESTVKAVIAVLPASGGGDGAQYAVPVLQVEAAAPQVDEVTLLEAFRLFSSRWRFDRLLSRHLAQREVTPCTGWPPWVLLQHLTSGLICAAMQGTVVDPADFWSRPPPERLTANQKDPAARLAKVEAELAALKRQEKQRATQ